MKTLRRSLGVVAAASLVATFAAADPSAGLAPAGGLDEVDRALVTLTQEERTLRQELDELGPRAADARRRSLARGRVLYRLVRAGLLPVGGGFDSLVAHAAKVERARHALEQDLAAFQGDSDRRALLHKRLEQIASRKTSLEVEQQAAVRARAALEEAEDRKLAYDRAFQASTGSSDYVAIYGAGAGPGEPGSESGRGFGAMRGRLAFPIAGRIEIHAVRRDGAPGPGVEMRAPVGTAVRAVMSGRVAFADRNEPYGKVVVLDHGDRYFTVMGDLATIDVRVGDDVANGARVGTVGDDGKGSRLYFEVRHGGQALDASQWLGL